MVPCFVIVVLPSGGRGQALAQSQAQHQVKTQTQWSASRRKAVVRRRSSRAAVQNLTCHSAPHDDGGLGAFDGVYPEVGTGAPLDSVDRICDPLDFEQDGSGSGTGGGGGGNGGSGDGGSDEDGDARAGLPHEYTERLRKLPPEIQQLPAEQLKSFLRTTSGGLGRWLSDTFPGWQSRVAADSDFPFKLLMEETVGLGLTTAGMVAARGPNILKELDFVFCDLSVGGTLNFILTWLLQPTVPKSGTELSQFQRYIAQLPANVFSAPRTGFAPYGNSSRAMAFVYKGVLFGMAGFVAALSGTSISYALMRARSASGTGGQGQRESESERPGLLKNSLAWSAFMVLSSNPRYQLLAGAEQVLFKSQSVAVAKFGCGALRLGNNVWGGATWVIFARAVGVQKRPEAEH